jgi:pimeloyl-ACP methyl ester carboxylesterase
LIEDAGHYPHIERPDLFTRKIVEFVSHTKRRET